MPPHVRKRKQKKNISWSVALMVKFVIRQGLCRPDAQTRGCFYVFIAFTSNGTALLPKPKIMCLLGGLS